MDKTDEDKILSFEELIRRGKELSSISHFKEAEEHLKKAEELLDDSAEEVEMLHLHYTRGILKFEMKEYENCLFEVEKVITHSKKCSKEYEKLYNVFNLRGLCYKNLDKKKRARTDLTKAIEIAYRRESTSNRSFGNMYYNRGIINNSLGYNRQAVSDFWDSQKYLSKCEKQSEKETLKHAVLYELSIRGEMKESVSNRERVYQCLLYLVKNGEGDEEKKKYLDKLVQRVESCQKEDSPLLRKLKVYQSVKLSFRDKIEGFVQNSDYKKAIELGTRLFEITCDGSWSRRCEEKALFEMTDEVFHGRWEDGMESKFGLTEIQCRQICKFSLLRIYQLSRDSTEEYEVFENLGTILQEFEEYEDAIRVFTEAIEKFPDEKNYSLFSRGSCYENTEDYEMCIRDGEEFLSLDHTEDDLEFERPKIVRGRLTRCYKLRGDHVKYYFYKFHQNFNFSRIIAKLSARKVIKNSPLYNIISEEGKLLEGGYDAKILRNINRSKIEREFLFAHISKYVMGESEAMKKFVHKKSLSGDGGELLDLVLKKEDLNNSTTEVEDRIDMIKNLSTALSGGDEKEGAYSQHLRINWSNCVFSIPRYFAPNFSKEESEVKKTDVHKIVQLSIRNEHLVSEVSRLKEEEINDLGKERDNLKRKRIEESEEEEEEEDGDSGQRPQKRRKI